VFPTNSWPAPKDTYVNVEGITFGWDDHPCLLAIKLDVWGGATQCCALCQQVKGCTSVNFNQEHGICELLCDRRLTSDDRIQHLKGWRYIHVYASNTIICPAPLFATELVGHTVAEANLDGDWETCCTLCHSHPDCAAYTYNIKSGVCYLKGPHYTKQPRQGFVSAMVERGAFAVSCPLMLGRNALQFIAMYVSVVQEARSSSRQADG